MARYTVVNGDLGVLKTVLENSGYFDTVRKVDGVNFGRIEATKGNLTFKLGASIDSEAFDDTWYVYASGLQTSALRDLGGTSGSYYGFLDYEPVGVYECAGGLSIICSAGRIAIGKTNNDETAVMFGSYIADAYVKDLALRLEGNMRFIEAISESDDGVNNAFGNNIDDTQRGAYLSRRYSQTLLIPVLTQSHIGKASYLTKVQVILYPQTRDTVNFVYNGKRYFSDGYFAIEDQEV